MNKYLFVRARTDEHGSMTLPSEVFEVIVKNVREQTLGDYHVVPIVGVDLLSINDDGLSKVLELDETTLDKIKEEIK